MTSGSGVAARLIVEQQEQELVIRNGHLRLADVRTLPGRQWRRETNTWHCPYVKEVYDAMVQRKFPVQHIERPDWSGYVIDRPYGQTAVLVQTLRTADDIQRCKRIPEGRSFSPKYGGWLCRPTIGNLEYLRRTFPSATWTDAALNLRKTLLQERDAPAPALPPVVKVAADVRDFKFPTSPHPDDPAIIRKARQHQVTAFSLARGRPGFGLFMEQRTGKCYVEICETMDLVAAGKIKAWWIVCPNSVKDVWKEELETWLPPEYEADVFIWDVGTKHKFDKWVHEQPPGETSLKVLVMNCEALSSKKGEAAVNLFGAKYPALATVDECTRFKTPSSSRTKALLRLKPRFPYRRIMSGTPITQGPLDIYAPFKFLGDNYLGFSSFYSMRNHHCIMGGWEGKQILGYVKLEELQQKVDQHSYRILFRDCSDMKDPVYDKRFIDLTPQQRAVYDELKSTMQAEVQDELGRRHKVSTMHVIVKLMRLQQIVGGFFPSESIDDEDVRVGPVRGIPIPGGNPKLEQLLEDVEALAGKVIIWARFRAEINIIQAKLRELYGPESTVEFHGGVTRLQRTANRNAFQDPKSKVRFFVGQPVTGGLGIPLWRADTTLFYSNDYNYEARKQAESRPLLPEKISPHLFMDYMARKTGDERIIKALRQKQGWSDIITKDPTLSWI